MFVVQPQKEVSAMNLPQGRPNRRRLGSEVSNQGCSQMGWKEPRTSVEFRVDCGDSQNQELLVAPVGAAEVLGLMGT